jgi:hypothetical protein
MTKPTVLIVWQNPLFREMVFAILRHSGISAIDAVSMGDVLAGKSLAPPSHIVVEGGQDEGHALLQRWDTNSTIQILAFTMGDNEAHWFQYKQWKGVTKDDIVEMLLGPGTTQRDRTPGSNASSSSSV